MRGLLLGAMLLAAAMAARADSADALFAATLANLDDKPAALKAWQGKPLIVNFWARWCGPCRAEIPELAKLRAAHQGKGLEVIGIAIEDKSEPVRDFAKAYDMDYPVLLGKEQGIPLMQALGNSKGGLPFTIAVDRKGNIVSRKLGAIKPAELEAAAAAVLK